MDYLIVYSVICRNVSFIAEVAELEKTAAELKAKVEEKSEKLMVAEVALKKANADLKVTSLALEKERERSKALQESTAVLKTDLREARKSEGESRTAKCQLTAEVGPASKLLFYPGLSDRIGFDLIRFSIKKLQKPLNLIRFRFDITSIQIMIRF